jgi:hypothetical protein
MRQDDEQNELSEDEAIAIYRAANAMAAVVYAVTADGRGGIAGTMEAIDLLRGAAARTLLDISETRGDAETADQVRKAYSNPPDLDLCGVRFALEGETAHLAPIEWKEED